MDQRQKHLTTFYAMLSRLEHSLGGARTLVRCSGRLLDWPTRGVYFFREPGEHRAAQGAGLRIVRVGTHALKTGSRTKLWTRLSQHKGSGTGNGNHRGSIFRLIVGAALCNRDGRQFPTWGIGHPPRYEVRTGERALECDVSRIIGNMPFLWLRLDDEAGPESMRGFIERNSVALLSNYHKESLDPPSQNWLGNHSDRERVRGSGLWNCNHVDEDYDPGFLKELDRLITAAGSAS